MREMKDSGIKDINHIPKEYKPSKLKYVADIYGRIGFRGYTQQDLVDEGEGPISLSPSNFNNTKMNFEKCSFLTWEKYYESPEIMIHNGDILFVKTGSSYGKNCYVDDLPMECTINPQLVVIKNTKINSKWLSYFLQTKHIENLSELAVVGGTIPTMSQEKIGNFTIIIPPKEEQEKIVDYLDIKCTEIDKISTDLQHQIEFLQEYKQSVITEAVTKGIRGARPMKNSGVNWIDKIPADWDFKKITWLLDYNSIYPIGDGDHGLIKADNYLDNGIPFIRVQNLGWGTDLQLENIVYISKEMNHCISNSTLRPNDIVFAKTGATIGKTAIIPESLPISNTTSHVGKITISSKYYPKFIFHYLSSKIGYKLFWDIALMKTTRPEVGIEEFKQVRILIPRDIEEQKEISTYIERKCKEIDIILADKQKQLDTLTEYKKSLIYEYVTGKKEVPVDA